MSKYYSIAHGMYCKSVLIVNWILQNIIMFLNLYNLRVITSLVCLFIHETWTNENR